MKAVRDHFSLEKKSPVSTAESVHLFLPQSKYSFTNLGNSWTIFHAPDKHRVFSSPELKLQSTWYTAGDRCILILELTEVRLPCMSVMKLGTLILAPHLLLIPFSQLKRQHPIYNSFWREMAFSLHFPPLAHQHINYSSSTAALQASTTAIGEPRGHPLSSDS